MIISFFSELKKGVYKHPTEQNIYFRYRYRIDRARTFTDRHILALHQGNEKSVVVCCLPGLEKSYLTENQFRDDYGFKTRKDKRGKKLAALHALASIVK